MKCALTVVALLASAGPALAHGPAPAGLGVLATGGAADDPARPDVVRTNVGLALALPDGRYAYGCPSQWGGAEQGFGAALPGRALVVMLGKGRAYGSTDRGCRFSALPLPDGTGHATQAVDWRGRVWVLTRSATGGAVVSVGTALDVREERRFGAGGEAAWTPDALFAASGEADGLWVAGARPLPALWWASAGGAWTPIEGLPEAPGLQRLEVAEARGDVDGAELWLMATLPEGRQLWRARLESGRLTVTPEAAAAQVLHGPVAFGEGLLAVRDGVLQHAARWPDAGEGAWTSLGEVDWTCLQRHGAQVYACTLPALLAVEAVGPEGARTRPVWRLAQLGGPPAGCPPEAAARTACELDWLHFGAEAGLTDREPSTAPSDDPEGGPGPMPAADQGCRGGGAAGWGAALWALLSLGWRPRGRRGAS